MRNWKQHNEKTRQDIVACLDALAGKGVIWITCDSMACSADTRLWLEQAYRPGAHATGYYALSDKRTLVGDLETAWRMSSNYSETPLTLMHWKGLGYYTEEVFEEAIPGYYDQVAQAAVLPDAGLPFTTLLWTDATTRRLIAAGAPAFLQAITHHFHLEDPPFSVVHEVEAMRRETMEVRGGMLDALASYQLGHVFQLMDKVDEPKAGRILLEYGAKLAAIIEDFDQALRMLQDSLRMPLPMTPVKKGEYQFNMAICHSHLGQLGEANKCFEASLKVAQQVKDDSKQVMCLVALGGTALAEGKPMPAFRYLEQALSLALEMEDGQAEVIRVILRLGPAQEAAGNWEGAKATYQVFFDEGYHIDDSQGDAQFTMLKVGAMRGLGEAEEIKAEVAEALARLQTDTGEWLDGAYLLKFLQGRIEIEAGDLQAGLAALTDSAQLATATGDQDVLPQIYKLLATAHTQLGDDEAAVLAYLHAMKWSDREDDEVRDELGAHLDALIARFGEDRVNALLTEHLPGVTGRGGA